MNQVQLDLGPRQLAVDPLRLGLADLGRHEHVVDVQLGDQLLEFADAARDLRLAVGDRPGRPVVVNEADHVVAEPAGLGVQRAGQLLPCGPAPTTSMRPPMTRRRRSARSTRRSASRPSRPRSAPTPR